MDSYHEFIDPNKSPVDAGAKEPEDLGSVRLRLGGFPVTRSQNPPNAALSVHAPSVLPTGQTKGRQANTADDRTDPFQTALKDAQKESSRTGKVPVSSDVPPLSSSSNSKYSLWTCGQQLKDVRAKIFYSIDFFQTSTVDR